MGTNQWMRNEETKFGVHVLVVIFGTTSWSIMNGLWVELPILVTYLPEGWTLPSYLTITTQFGFLGLLLYSLLCYLKPRNKLETPASFVIVTALTLCALLYSFFWAETASVAGSQHSVALLGLTFSQAAFAATTSIAYVTFMAHLKARYMASIFIGMGLSGLIPALAAIGQGMGSVRCVDLTNQTDEGASNGTHGLTTKSWNSSDVGGNVTAMNWTRHGTRDSHLATNQEPAFSIQAFFLLLFGIGILSLLSLVMLVFHPYCSSEHVDTDKEENCRLMEVNRKHEIKKTTTENGDEEKLQSPTPSSDQDTTVAMNNHNQLLEVRNVQPTTSQPLATLKTQLSGETTAAMSCNPLSYPPLLNEDLQEKSVSSTADVNAAHSMRILSQYSSILQSDPITRHLFPEPSVVAFKRDRNLCDLLVHSRLPSISHARHGTIPCDRPVCKTCPYVFETSFISFPKAKFEDGAVDDGSDVRVRNGDAAIIDNEEAAARGQGKQLSKLQSWYLLALLVWINALQTSFVLAIQVYSSLPYGIQFYHAATKAENIVDPIASFLTFWISATSTAAISGLVLLGTLFTAYIVTVAAMSPNPFLVNETAGGVLVVTAWVMCTMLMVFCKVSIASVMRGQGRLSLMWTGGSTQLGALLGAVLAYLLINHLHLFKDEPWC